MSMDSIVNIYVGLLGVLQPIFILFVVVYVLRLASRLVGAVEKVAARGSAQHSP